MKSRSIGLKIALAGVFLTFFCAPIGAADAEFHIGIATNTLSQQEDVIRGAEQMIKEYGNSSEGGMITHITHPDNFMSEMETTVGQLVGLADDPKMKVIVANEAVPGTTEAFRRIRERRPDIILLAGEAHEDPSVISSATDLAVTSDNIARGYLIPLIAQKLGAKVFVHISFPRHMSYEILSRRRAIMEETCKDLGIQYFSETAPDPMSDVGVPGAQQFILEKVPDWLEKYGKDTAFYCTNNAQTEPLIKRIAELGGYFIEPDIPSPLLGYPGALGIDLSEEKGNWPAILQKVEKAVEAAGGGGRMGAWAFSFGYTQSAGLVEFGKRVVEGTAKLDSLRDLVACYDKYTPGARWQASYYTDAGTGVRNRQLLLMRQDTYIFGKGYMNLSEVEIPEKYFKVK
jgi:hypothetical protein